MPKRSSRQAKPTTTAFDEQYRKLNPAQRSAVDAIDGPVMVVAGPGSGKTQVLAMRVANILKQTQAYPGNILCLTFSTSGAKAMRERLRSIIGPDAYGVTIETVHGFCNSIILEHPHIFEDFRALEQVSDVERIRIVRRALKSLPPGSVLGKPTFIEDRSSAILSRISEMKREGMSPENLRAILPEFRAEIGTTKTGKERDTSTQAYRDDMKRVRQFEEFIAIYDSYEQALDETHRYDYDDTILICTEALQKHDWILASLQERYLYCLVDEFQDLNGAQHGVINLLMREVIAGQRPNIFVVGDDDQAIYRFQGASVAAMQAFIARFPDAPTISLTENYRSTQPILDAAGAIISRNEDRLVRHIPGLDKSLHSAIGKGDRPLFLRYPAIDHERSGIAQLLTQAHDDGADWSKMAVLCRRNEELEPLYATLHAAGVPVILTAKRDLITQGTVREAITLLRAAEHIDHDAVLSAALACPCLGNHPANLGALWCTYREAQYKGESPSLRSYILARRESLSPALLHSIELLEELHGDAGRETLPAILEKLLKKSSLLPAQNAVKADPQIIAVLHAFYDYVKDWSYENKKLSLPLLLDTLDQYLAEKGLRLEYDVPHLTADGVNLMTAHAAKGLEFDLVILAHTRFRNWGDRIRGSSLALPDHLMTGFEAGEERRLKQEDERRLLFVAMTRSRSRLLLTFSETYPSNDAMKAAQPMSFLAEADGTIDERTVPSLELPKPIETLWQPPILIDEAFEAFLRERLEDFRLSVTALNCFLRDPQEFLWTQLMKQPQAKASHLSFGSIIHMVLERRNLAWQAGEDFSTDDLLMLFQTIMHEREVMPEHDRKHYLHEGMIILKRYGEATEKDHPIILSAERSLNATLPGRHQGADILIPLYGKVDRIDLLFPNSQECRVIDYKTGAPKRTPDAIRKEEDVFRQLVFYKILCDSSPSFTHTASVFALDYVGKEDGNRSCVEFTITHEEITALRELITRVWEKILQLDFTPLQ